MIDLIDDVLQQVFICHVVSDPCYYKGFSPIGYFPSRTLSHVCSQWRHIALHTPQLWNNIYIRYLTPENLRKARYYLSRVGSIPISISLGYHLPITVDQVSIPNVTNFLSSYRLQSIRVPKSILLFPSILRDLPQRSVADLESLIINHDCELGSIEVDDIRYPRLAIVTLPIRYKLFGCSSSLRIFNGKESGLTISESWDLLRNFPALEDVWLRIMRGNIRQCVVSQITLQHLHTLKISSAELRDRAHFRVFIAPLSLPRLEELFVVSGVVWCTTAFQSLIQRSNYMPHLTRFILVGPEWECDNIDAGALLASMPYVTDITICCSRCRTHNNDIFFEPLALTRLASGLLAPRLQRLGLGYSKNVRGILDMIELRMKNAEISKNGIPAPFTEIVLYEDIDVREMQKKGIPVILGEFRRTLHGAFKQKTEYY